MKRMKIIIVVVILSLVTILTVGVASSISATVGGASYSGISLYDNSW